MTLSPNIGSSSHLLPLLQRPDHQCRCPSAQAPQRSPPPDVIGNISEGEGIAKHVVGFDNHSRHDTGSAGGSGKHVGWDAGTCSATSVDFVPLTRGVCKRHPLPVLLSDLDAALARSGEVLVDYVKTVEDGLGGAEGDDNETGTVKGGRER